MNTEELNALKNRAQKIAVEHGFYMDVKPDAYYLGLIMSVMGRAISADQKGYHADMELFEELLTNENPFSNAFFLSIKDSVEDEIADIVIRLLDFAGIKEYELRIEVHPISDCKMALWTLGESGLSGTLFYLMNILTDSFYFGDIRSCISNLIDILFNCFGKMTGSDKDLWWFVKQKMRYNGCDRC